MIPRPHDRTATTVLGSGLGTGARSHALAAHLRDRIEAKLEGAGDVAALTGDLRAGLRDRGVRASDRNAAIRAAVADSALWTALDTGGANVGQLAESVISDVTGDPS